MLARALCVKCTTNAFFSLTGIAHPGKATSGFNCHYDFKFYANHKLFNTW